MKKVRLYLIITFFILGSCTASYAQVVGTSIYLPGNWVECGVAPNGSWGGNTTGGGATYYPYGGWNNIASVYDWQHNGWTVGAQPRFGDYTFPGTPFEGWAIEVNGARSDAFYTTNAAWTGTGFWNQTAAVSALTGANTTYTNAGGTATAVWHGTTTGTSGGLSITQTTQIDQFASWIVTTVEFTNTSAAAIPGVYYWRDFDPDNDETYSGNFATNNTIIYQNPILPAANNIDHKAMVGAAGTAYANATIAIGTKDCRARVLINYQWSPYPNRAVTLAQVYNGTTGTGLTQTWYNVTYPTITTAAQDIAMGLVYNIGTIPAGGSAVICFANMYDGNLYPQTDLDSAFPEPALIVNGVTIPPTGPAPDVTRDTFNACGSGLTTLPVSIANATTKNWTWSTWTWSPGTGLASTTGVTNTITLAGLPPIITYTITGSDSNANMYSCNTRTMYLTILSCSGATVNTPCLGGALTFNDTGAAGATYSWYGPAPSTTVVATTQSFTITPSVWADTGTYHVIKTAGGVSDTNSVLVVIEPNPVVTAASNSPICATATSATLTLTSTSTVTPVTYSWSGPAGFTSTLQNPTIPGFVAADAGTYTVTVTSSFGCIGSATTLVVYVAPVTGDTAICVGGSTQLSDVTPGGTWASSNLTVATVGATGIVYGVAGGFTTITYGDEGCNQTISVHVYQPGPITPTSICIGGTTTLTAFTPGGTWTSSNTGIATIGLTSGIGTGVSPGTTNITYGVGPGCTVTAVLTVTSPTSITGIMTVCPGSNITLSEGATGGTWSSGNPGVATINVTSGVVTGVSTGTTPITYSIAGGCFVTATVTVSPLDPITGVASLCQRRATTTLTDGSSGGIWSSANPGIATITPTTGIVYGVSPGIATISYTNSFGCISTIAVTVDPTPPPPGVTPVTYCQYYLPALQFVATGAGPTFTWWGPGVTTGYSPAPIPSTAVPGVDSYYVTQTSGFGCESDSALQLVTIIPQPAPPVTDSVSYCVGANSAPLTAQVISSTGTLSWYLGGVLLTGTPTPSTATPTYPVGTTWYVAQTVNGCESDSSSINVDIVYKPDFTITNQPWVCQFDSISLAYTPAGPPLIGGAFLWSLPAGATLANGTTLTDSIIYAQFDSVNGNNYVYLTASDLGGQCSTTDTILINVVQLPTATATSKADVCLSDTVTLALSSKTASATNFTWYIDNSPLFSSPAATIIAANSNSGGPYSISWTDTGLHVIYVQAFAEHGCEGRPSADTVYVHSLPDASFYITTSTGTLCLEDSVLFSANDSNYQNNYSWAPVHFFGNNNIDKHAVWGKVEQTQSIVTLTITDPFGCIASNSRELDPNTCCNVTFPNAFSPNGDGKDDVFRPIPSQAYHIYHKFVIQNRWGQTVYESSDNKASWDGTFNGVPQDIGVYYYYLKYDCNGNTIEEKGDVTLVK